MNKRIKAVLLATPPAAVIAPAGWAGAAETRDGDPAHMKTVREFEEEEEEEAREWPKHDTKDGKSPEQEVDEPDTKYEAVA